MSCEDTWHVWWLRTLHAKGEETLVVYCWSPLKRHYYSSSWPLEMSTTPRCPLLETAAVCSYITGNSCQRQCWYTARLGRGGLDSCTGCSVCLETVLGSWSGVLKSVDRRKVQGSWRDASPSLTVGLTHQTLASTSDFLSEKYFLALLCRFSFIQVIQSSDFCVLTLDTYLALNKVLLSPTGV